MQCVGHVQTVKYYHRHRWHLNGAYSREIDDSRLKNEEPPSLLWTTPFSVCFNSGRLHLTPPRGKPHVKWDVSYTVRV